MNDQSKCPHCGGTSKVENIGVDLTAAAGNVGLSYQWGILLATEPLLADLCGQCGTAVRFHVQNPDRKWKTRQTSDPTNRETIKEPVKVDADEPLECLSCGNPIPADLKQCPQCGWSWK